MRAFLLWPIAIATLLIAASLFAPSTAVSSATATTAASDAPGSAALLLGLLGLAGLALAGGRPGARRPVLRTVLLSAVALLLPGSASAAPILSEVFFNPTGADDGLEWIEIYNAGPSTVDLSGYSLGWGGADYTTGTAQLSGMLLPGQYFVVGGPTSDASNGNPVFDQVVNFNPDLENSGWFQAADGVALFDVLATAITPTTVPVDAFIYGGAIFSTNSNGLLDETGSPGAVDFVQPFFGSGYSAESDGTSWSQQTNPTPNSGPLAVPEPGIAMLLGVGGALLGWTARRGAGTA
jgi:hypothetical protein